LLSLPFYRAAFHAEMNPAIVAFFKAQLPPPKIAVPA
jgi:hypothetical protein